MKKILVVFGMLLLLLSATSTNVGAISWCNGVCKLFENCDPNGSESTSSALQTSSQLEIMAASDFFNSTAAYKSFMDEVETSYTSDKIDYPTLSKFLSTAIGHMEKSNLSFSQLPPRLGMPKRTNWKLYAHSIIMRLKMSGGSWTRYLTW